MSKCTTLLRASAACVGAALAATAAALDRLEFVAGWPIEVPAGAEIFDVQLTPEIYAAADGIEQLAILDLNGEPQSFFRTGPAAPGAPTERRLVLEASPLYASSAASAPSVGVTTGPARTSVTVAPGSASAAQVVGFVLDARGVDAAPAALELDWRELPQPFLLDVAVEQSTDLTNWRSAGRASIAALAIGGSQVRHARVPVYASAGGYYRVTPRGSVSDWHLLRATFVIPVGQQPAAPPRIRVAPLAAGANPAAAPDNAVYFDAGGALPVQSVALVFAANDGWARADVAASRSLEGPWTSVAYGELFYALSFEGRELASEPVPVGRQEARYWRIVPTAPLRGQLPELELGLQQQQLRVAARGVAPYLLVAGTLADEAGPDATLSSVWSALDSTDVTVPLATLGARRELGGAAALVAPRVFPWRAAALWTVLVVGVLVVGAMAVRLAREMRSGT
jgi:hypothetical protein